MPGMVNLNFSSIKGGSGVFHTLMGPRFFALAHVYGHNTLNAPVLVQSLKLLARLRPVITCMGDLFGIQVADTTFCTLVITSAHSLNGSWLGLGLTRAPSLSIQ